MDISPANIQFALQAEDIEGLLALGAPNDEYSQEAQDIAAALAVLSGDQLTETHIVSVICDIWVKYFGPFLNEDIEKRNSAFQRIARCLL